MHGNMRGEGTDIENGDDTWSVESVGSDEWIYDKQLGSVFEGPILSLKTLVC